MGIRLGVIMDPIETIKPVKDSTLAMLLAAQRRGWELMYMTQADLAIRQGEALGRMAPLRVMDDGSRWFERGEPQWRPLAELDVILMRKDPPVDDQFIATTQILDLAERDGVCVVNRPQALRDCNEKLFATHFADVCPPLIVSRDMDALRAFHAEHGDVICKPLDGMGGASIFRVKADGDNLGVILETLTAHGRRQMMMQAFIPEIREGDKRILMIRGEPVPYALARLPAQGEHRGNLAAGGRGEGRPLSDRDREIAARVGPELVRRGILFAGLDVIGDWLTEVNVTSPTCIRELDAQFGLDIAGQLMDEIEKEVV
ncbi:MAG: glutathione synthase [Gammaproteobacteria bacterium]|nr:MAG: glutathione synthase [Gammaproteobacteria bacterium]